MPEHAAVLFANDIFYLAFANQDFEAMQLIWAEKSPVTCIHPGWDVLSDREEVLESWEQILGNPNPTNIVCKSATVRVLGPIAYVICHEVLDQGYLVATNVFIQEDGKWKMVHHQAGAAPEPDIAEEEIQDTLQ
ncbi:MAG: nuclear transport factor 2 family protein [Rhodospirillales bacterium]|nr:nuclear transport factor 2 family protein [Rhodospirillales bacterium]